MRPLPLPEDYYWHEIDQASYDLEIERMHTEYEKQWSEHMSRFQTPYKLTLREIKDRIRSCEKNIKSMRILKVPEILIESKQHEMDELVMRWTSGEYLKTKSDEIYRKAYEDWESKFEFDFIPVVPDHVAYGISRRMVDSDRIKDDGDVVTW